MTDDTQQQEVEEIDDDVEVEDETDDVEDENTDEQPEVEEQAEEKPAKKPRKPRSDVGVKRGPRKPKAEKEAPKKRGRPPKAKVEEVVAEAPKKRGRPSTKVANFVRQEGSVMTISGADVYCRRLTPKKMEEWGIRKIESGKMGVPCAEVPLVMRFKSPKSAAKFFTHSFGAENEADEIIVSGNKTDWESDALDDFLG